MLPLRFSDNILFFSFKVGAALLPGLDADPDHGHHGGHHGGHHQKCRYEYETVYDTVKI